MHPISCKPRAIADKSLSMLRRLTEYMSTKSSNVAAIRVKRGLRHIAHSSKKFVQWRAADKRVALATVVSTWGSSPRPEGSHLAVDEAGYFIGSVSGGCIEGAVIEVASQVMACGKCQLLEFGISDEQAWQVGLACGGRIVVFVELVQ
jgi:hypothetical protein